MFLVILAQSAATSRAYAVKYQERFVENDDLVGLSAANLAAGFSGTFVVNGSPTKTEMVDEAKSHTQVAQLTTAVVVAIVLLFLTKPLQYLPNAVLAAVVFLIGLKLVEVAEHARDLAPAQGRVRDRGPDRDRRRRRGRRAGHHPRDRPVRDPARPAPLHTARPRRRLGLRREARTRAPTPGTVSEPGPRRSTASPSASSTRTPSASPRRCSGSSADRSRRVGSSSTPSRSTTSTTRAARPSRRSPISWPSAKIVLAIAEASPHLRVELDRFGVTATHRRRSLLRRDRGRTRGVPRVGTGIGAGVCAYERQPMRFRRPRRSTFPRHLTTEGQWRSTRLEHRKNGRPLARSSRSSRPSMPSLAARPRRSDASFPGSGGEGVRVRDRGREEDARGALRRPLAAPGLQHHVWARLRGRRLPRLHEPRGRARPHARASRPPRRVADLLLPRADRSADRLQAADGLADSPTCRRTGPTSPGTSGSP